MKQANKLHICNTYHSILYIVGVLNKGYILRKQLEEYCDLLDITDSKYAFEKAIKELEKHQIIKQINFMNTNYKIVMLKKFGIGFLKGYSENYSSQKISAIKTCSSNERYLKSIMFNEYTLNLLRKSEINRNRIKKINFFNFFYANFSNFLLTTDKFCDLLETKYGEYINLNNLKETKEIYLKEVENRQKAIEISRQARLDKDYKPKKSNKGTTYGKRNQEQRNKLMRDGTIETLRKKGSYLRIVFKNNQLNVYLYYFDHKNQQDRLKMIEHLALTISISKSLFKDNIPIKYHFIGYMYSEKACNKAYKEMTDIKDLKYTLRRMYCFPYIFTLNQSNYEVQIFNLDIENKYLNQSVIKLDTEIQKEKDKEIKNLKDKIKELEQLLEKQNNCKDEFTYF